MHVRNKAMNRTAAHRHILFPICSCSSKLCRLCKTSDLPRASQARKSDEKRFQRTSEPCSRPRKWIFARCEPYKKMICILLWSPGCTKTNILEALRVAVVCSKCVAWRARQSSHEQKTVESVVLYRVHFLPAAGSICFSAYNARPITLICSLWIGWRCSGFVLSSSRFTTAGIFYKIWAVSIVSEILYWYGVAVHEGLQQKNNCSLNKDCDILPVKRLRRATLYLCNDFFCARAVQLC